MVTLLIGHVRMFGLIYKTNILFGGIQAKSIIKSLGGQIEFYPKLKATIFESHTCEGTHMPLT